jgi:hypothetical protein
MRTVDFDTLNLHWLQPSRTHNLDSTCSPNKALQLTIFPLLRNSKTAVELCVRHFRWRKVEDEFDSPHFALWRYNADSGRHATPVADL